jgi:NADH-quinone oxidoreductase subunit C
MCIQYNSYSSCLVFAFSKIIKNLIILLNNFEFSINCPSVELVFVVKLLRYSALFRFIYLPDIFGVDYPSAISRFQLVYIVVSNLFNFRLSLKVRVGVFDNLESLAPIYYSSVWLEREVWDLFGVFFFGHPDLRRILTDYGFVGYPLRKDYPLSGFLELRYNEGLKRIIYEPVEFSQKYRYFDFRRPWN